MKRGLASRYALPVVAASALAGCARHYEAQRAPAPGGGVEATLWASELHGDVGYEVHVVPAGGAANGGPAVLSFEGVVRRGGGAGLRLQWLQPDLLLVQYGDARSVSQRSPAVDVDGHHVRIELQPGAAD